MNYKEEIYVGSISTVLPRKCGIASFNSDMINSLRKDNRVNGWGLYAIEKPIEKPNENIKKPDEEINYDYKTRNHIRAHINQNQSKSQKTLGNQISWEELGDQIVEETEDRKNEGVLSGYFISHENGIFGKHHTEDNLVPLLKHLKENGVPTITILHTILSNPDKQKLETLQGILENTDKAIVLSRSCEKTLRDVYNAPRGKSIYIPHGVPEEYVHESREEIKEQEGFLDKQGNPRPVFLSWGYLSPSKGLEYPLEAFSKVIKDYPEALFWIAGGTHPEVKKNEGEKYRNSLEQLARDEKIPTAIKTNGKLKDLNGNELKDLKEVNLCFLNRHLKDKEPPRMMKGSNFGVVGNLGEAQVSSGPGSWWIGSSRITMATASPFFKDMEDEGVGLLVGFRSVDDFEDRMRHGLDLYRNDRRALDGLEFNASDEASTRTWDVIGKIYLNLMNKIVRHKVE